jgi:hypothetical protein
MYPTIKTSLKPYLYVFDKFWHVENRQAHLELDVKLVKKCDHLRAGDE